MIIKCTWCVGFDVLVVDPLVVFLIEECLIVIDHILTQSLGDDTSVFIRPIGTASSNIIQTFLRK